MDSGSDWSEFGVPSCYQRYPGTGWARAIGLLLELHAGSLQLLSLESSSCTGLSLDHIVFPRLEILKLEAIDFQREKEMFDDDLKAFYKLPTIRKPHSKWCSGIPKSCNWFKPASKARRWPNLKTLCMGEMKTFYGPGDDLWDDLDLNMREKMEESCEEDGCWSSKDRIALENNCNVRGIDLECDWDFYEFC